MIYQTEECQWNVESGFGFWNSKRMENWNEIERYSLENGMKLKIFWKFKGSIEKHWKMEGFIKNLLENGSFY